MKSSNVVKIVIIVVIILAVAGTILYFVNQNNKKYSIEKIEEYEYFLLKQEDKFGIIDKNGNTLITPNYTEIKIPNPQKPLFICTNNNKTVILNDKQEEILTQYNIKPIEIEGTVSNLPYEKSILKYEKDGKYGLINLEGKEITKPIYEEIQGLAHKETELLVKKDGKYGVINSKGAIIISNKYDKVVADGFYTETEGYELSGYITSEKTQEGYRYGYINNKHKKILEPEYTDIARVVEINEKDNVYLLIVKNGQVGIMKNEKIIADYKYQDIEYHASNKTFILQRNSKFGIANIEGQIILPVEYENIEFKGDYISTTLNDETIVFDLQGNKVQDVVYDSISKVGETDYYITIDKSGKYGIISGNRNIKIDNKYQYIEYLFENYFIASQEDGNLGIVDVNGNIMAEFEYDVIQKIESTNIIEAKKLNKSISDLYSVDMKKILSATSLNIYVKDNYVQTISDNIKYFDLDGNELESKQVLKNNELFASKQSNKWGFVNKENKVIVEYNYDMVTEFNEYGYAGIKLGNKWGVINTKGEIVQEPIYKLNSIPEVMGKYYKVYYGYGESYYTNSQEEH